MKRGLTGAYRRSTTAGETVKAFCPFPLPPEPPLDLAGRRQKLLQRATLACGRLDGLSSILPDPDLFIYGYIRREAVLSSQIEGTQSSLSDLLLFESKEVAGAPTSDVVDVSNYVAAAEHGLARLRAGLPVSARLIREVHKLLLSRGRGEGKQPGEFRTTQNWIGGSRPGDAHFVPPPPSDVIECVSDLEKFIHADDDLPDLVRAGVAHVQFETIHPFLDGNGRVGRLLIIMMLIESGVLRAPMLYLSLYLKKRRQDYYRLLDSVRFEGDWEAWIEFFLEGVAETAESAATTAEKILSLFRDDERKAAALSPSALKVYKAVQAKPFAQVQDIATQAGVSYPTALKTLEQFRITGMLHEVTRQKRNRLYAYKAYIDLLNEDGAPIPT